MDKPSMPYDADTIEPIIRSTVKQFIPRQEREDAEQEIRLALLTKILPSYDPSRGNFFPFITTAIRNATIDIARALRSQRDGSPTQLEHEPTAPDQSHDRQIEALAGTILDTPHIHLTPFKAKILRALMEHRGKARAEVADLLGINIGTLWRALNDIREDIRNEIPELMNTRVG